MTVTNACSARRRYLSSHSGKYVPARNFGTGQEMARARTARRFTCALRHHAEGSVVEASSRPRAASDVAGRAGLTFVQAF